MTTRESTKLCILFLICTYANAAPAKSCQSNECPRYEVLESKNGYELRRYHPTTWIKTESVYRDGTNTAGIFSRNTFFTLYGYLNRGNSARMSIDMTAPVITKYEPGFPLQPNRVETRYFLVPAGLGSDPPTPTDSAVTLETWPEREIYVRSYGGWTNDAKKQTHFDELVAAINNPRLYNSSFVISAGYDSPFTFFNRRNEIWLVKV